MPGSASLFASPVKDKTKPVEVGKSDESSLHARGRKFGERLLENVRPGFVPIIPDFPSVAREIQRVYGVSSGHEAAVDSLYIFCGFNRGGGRGSRLYTCLQYIWDRCHAGCSREDVLSPELGNWWISLAEQGGRVPLSFDWEALKQNPQRCQPWYHIPDMDGQILVDICGQDSLDKLDAEGQALAVSDLKTFACAAFCRWIEVNLEEGVEHLEPTTAHGLQVLLALAARVEDPVDSAVKRSAMYGAMLRCTPVMIGAFHSYLATLHVAAREAASLSISAGTEKIAAAISELGFPEGFHAKNWPAPYLSYLRQLGFLLAHQAFSGTINARIFADNLARWLDEISAASRDYEHHNASSSAAHLLGAPGSRLRDTAVNGQHTAFDEDAYLSALHANRDGGFLGGGAFEGLSMQPTGQAVDAYAEQRQHQHQHQRQPLHPPRVQLGNQHLSQQPLGATATAGNLLAQPAQLAAELATLQQQIASLQQQLAQAAPAGAGEQQRQQHQQQQQQQHQQHQHQHHQQQCLPHQPPYLPPQHQQRQHHHHQQQYPPQQHQREQQHHQQHQRQHQYRHQHQHHHLHQHPQLHQQQPGDWERTNPHQSVPGIRRDLDGGQWYEGYFVPDAKAAEDLTTDFGKSSNPFMFISTDCVKTRATSHNLVDKSSRSTLLEHRMSTTHNGQRGDYEQLYFSTVRSAVNYEFYNEAKQKAIWKNESTFDSTLTSFIQVCRDEMGVLPIGYNRTKVDDQRSAIADLKLSKEERKQAGHTWTSLQPLYEDVFAEILQLRDMCRGHEDGANSCYFDHKLTQYLKMRAADGWKSDRMTELSLNAQQKSIRALEEKAAAKPAPADKAKELKCPYCTAVNGRPTYGFCHLNFCPNFLKFKNEADAHTKKK
jgi:hypothetical protein